MVEIPSSGKMVNTVSFKRTPQCEGIFQLASFSGRGITGWQSGAGWYSISVNFHRVGVIKIRISLSRLTGPGCLSFLVASGRNKHIIGPSNGDGSVIRFNWAKGRRPFRCVETLKRVFVEFDFSVFLRSRGAFFPSPARIANAYPRAEY